MSSAIDDGPKPPLTGDVTALQSGALRGVLRDASLYAGGAVGVHAIAALLTPVFALLLAPAELGVWALAMSVLSGLSHVYTLGLHGAVARFHVHYERRPAEQLRFTASVASFVLLWGAMVSLVLLAVGPELFLDISPSLPFWPHGMFIVSMCLLSAVSMVPQALWQAQRRPKAFVAVELVASVVFVVVSLALLTLTSLGVVGLFWGRLLGLAVTGLAFLFYAARQFGFDWYGPSLVTALFFGLPIALQLLALWMTGMADRFLIERQLGVAAVGVYAAAYGVTDVIRVVAAAGNRAWQPYFLRAFTAEDHPALVARSVTYFMAAVATAAVGLFVLSPTLIRMLLPDEYRPAAEAAPLLALAGGFSGLLHVYGAGLALVKKNGALPLVSLAAGVLTLGLNLVLLPRLGLMGAAWATLAGNVALALGMRWACRRHVTIPFESGRMARLIAVCAGFGVVGLAIDGRFPPAAELVAKLVLFGVAFLALTRAGFFAPAELQRLRAALGLPVE